MVIICANSVKRNFVKLKSVRTLFRIACVADRKSYVVIICSSSYETTGKEMIKILNRDFHCWDTEIVITNAVCAII